jgi:AraC-like DNA-binding protein
MPALVSAHKKHGEVPAFPVQHCQLLRGLNVFENQRDWVWETARRRHFNLWICTSGSGELQLAGHRAEFQPWVAFWICPTDALLGRSSKASVPVSNLSAHWLFKGEAVPVPDVRGPIVLSQLDAVRALVRQLLRACLHRDALAKQQQQLAFQQLLAHVWRDAHSPAETPLERTIRAQVQRMQAGQGLFLKTQTLAAEAHLGRVHYGRAFRQIMGVPPNRFQVMQRMERACILLQETEWTLERIAAVVGYQDTGFFCRQFRAELKVTPGNYRQRQSGL